MRINHNIAALTNLGVQQRVRRDMGTSLERLSTGLRINRASDDAAGLGVSETLRSQVRGSAQALRNAQDAVSLVDIAEGAMHEMSAILQRCRELALQASNDTLTSTERSYLNTEYSALVDEIDRINDATTYNGIQVLAGGIASAAATDLETKLEQEWLGGAMNRVNSIYGLTVNGPLEVKVENIDGLSGTGGYGGGSGSSVSGNGFMTLDAADFEVAVDSGDQEGSMPQYGGIINGEQLVTHEMTHVMQYMNGLSTPTWFAEGAAEASYGADERVDSILAANPGWDENDIINAASFVNGGNVSMDNTFDNSGIDYAAAYLMVMHLDAQTGGAGNGVSAIFADMKNNGSTFDQALSTALGGGVAGWEGTVTGGALAAGDFGNYSGSGDIAGLGDDIGALDLSGGALPHGFTALSIEVGESMTMHIGANSQTGVDDIEVSMASCSSGSLGVDTSGVQSQSAANSALGVLDGAIDQLNENRAIAGSYRKRFEHTINNLTVEITNQQDAESRIRDTDFATTSAGFTRSQILMQSSTAMLAQANIVPQSVLQLLG